MTHTRTRTHTSNPRGTVMQVHAGRTQGARYDHRAPIHIAVSGGPGTLVTALCSALEVAAIPDNRVSITCSRCMDQISRLPEVLGDPEMVCTNVG